MFEELIIKVGYESFKTQFDSFKLQAGKKYSIFVELADRDIRNPETLIIQNKLNNAIDESEADLITLFDFIKSLQAKTSVSFPTKESAKKSTLFSIPNFTISLSSSVKADSIFLS